MLVMQARSPRSSAFTLRTERLGPLPLVNHFIERMGLEAHLEKHVPTTDRRCRLSPAQALGVLVRSIVVEREPIYRAQETVHGFAAGLFGVAGEDREAQKLFDHPTDIPWGMICTRNGVSRVVLQ